MYELTHSYPQQTLCTFSSGRAARFGKVGFGGPGNEATRRVRRHEASHITRASQPGRTFGCKVKKLTRRRTAELYRFAGDGRDDALTPV